MEHPIIRAISAPELATRLAAEPARGAEGAPSADGAGTPPLVLLDVREPWEVALAGLPGAINVPLGELARCWDALDPAWEIVCVCHHGIRSMHAAAFLAERGFERLLNLSGGVEAWSLQVDPALPRY